MSDIRNIVIVGGGTMGNGIAHVAAQSGFATTLVDIRQDLLDKAKTIIDKNLGRMVAKEKITAEQHSDTMARLSFSSDLAGAAAHADLVVEAVNENLDLKNRIFQTLDASAPAHAILASNTSSISITKIANATKRPEQVVGMHFFNPVPMMRLVEIVRGYKTTDAVSESIRDLSVKMGKEPVLVNDYPGFVSNRVLMPMINEAIYCVYEGVATPEAVDQVMKLGMAHPMGPLRLADFIGLDVCLAILNVLYEGFKDPKYRPCPLLVRMVDAGVLGDKTGRGFYAS